MLRYLSSGIRDQKNHSWATGLEVRGNWEFMAIIEGKAKPECSDGANFKFLPSRLWIMPPMSMHRWRLRKGERCEVIVMHFAAIPPRMQHFISYDRVTSLPLNATDIATIRAIHQELLPHYESPNLDCMVWFEKALIDLCILISGKFMGSKASARFDDGAVKVQQALDWYRVNLVQSPTVNTLCKALDVSPSRLSKLFKVALKEPPGHAFRRIALDEACRIMVETSLSLKETATMCGFPNSEQFYRAFRQQFHITPSKWRENAFYGKKGFRPSRH